MLGWACFTSNAADQLGFIPSFLNSNDERSAKEQFDTAYSHGGGWRPFEGFKFDPKTLVITYPGDDPLKPVAITKIRNERIIVYPYAWVMILQEDGSFEICRMD